MTLVLNNIEITCQAGPDIIDRILMQFRKRGLSVQELHYKTTENGLANCSVSFEETELNAEKIIKNLYRTHDIVSIQSLS